MGKAGKELRDRIKVLNAGFVGVAPGQQGARRSARWGMVAAVWGMLAVCVPTETRALGSKRGLPLLTVWAQRSCLRGGGVPGARAIVSTPTRAPVPCWSVSGFCLRLSCARVLALLAAQTA